MKNNIYIITECPYSGIFIAMLELSKILKSNGYNITYLLPLNERNRYWEKQLENENILKEYWNIVHIPLRRKYRYILWDVLKLRTFFLDKENYSVISYTSYAWKVTRLVYMINWVKNLYHCPSCVQTKRFPFFKRYVELLFEKFLSNKSDFYLSCGPSESYILETNLNIPNDKILLCPNFRTNINNNHIELTNKKYEFLYIWRIVKDKWVEILLRTFSSLNMLDKIVFIWEWTELKEYKNKYKDANFIWRINNDEVFNYLSQSRFFISASVMEWMPYTLLEAMEMGTVPIISNVEWHKDVVIDNVNGLLFEDELDLANILFKINFLDDSKYLDLSKMAKESICKMRAFWINKINHYFPIIK